MNQIQNKIDEAGSKFIHLNTIAATDKNLDEVNFATIGILVRKITPSSVDKRGNKARVSAL